MNDRQKRREQAFIAGFRSALLICSIHVRAIKLLLHLAGLPLWNNINRTAAKKISVAARRTEKFIGRLDRAIRGQMVWEEVHH